MFSSSLIDKLATLGIQATNLQNVSKRLRDNGQNALSNRVTKLNMAFSAMRHLTASEIQQLEQDMVRALMDEAHTGAPPVSTSVASIGVLEPLRDDRVLRQKIGL